MIDTLLTVTPDARTKIDGVRSFNDFPEAVLRIRVAGKDGPRFRYEIALEDPRDRAQQDVRSHRDGLAADDGDDQGEGHDEDNDKTQQTAHETLQIFDIGPSIECPSGRRKPNSAKRLYTSPPMRG